MWQLSKNRAGWNGSSELFTDTGRWQLPAPGEPYAIAFLMAENKYDLPHNLLARQAQQESYYRPDAVSPAGAIGIMQIIPKWHPDVNPNDPFDSIDYAGRYMRENYNRFGDWEKALAAYNWGPTALSKAINNYGYDWKKALPTETKKYVQNISQDVILA